MDNDKVIVGFTKYHNQMNELTSLKDLCLKLFSNDITIDKFREEMSILNKKYYWWV